MSNGQKVLITGCEGQIGSGFVDHLKSKQYNIIGIDQQAQSKHQGIEYHCVDITKPAVVKAMVASLKGPVDVLINNAGVAVFTPFEERSDEELDFVIDVNLKATIFMTQAVFNHSMKARAKGTIVNIGSIYGVVAGDMRLYGQGDRRTSEIYGATKAAVIQLTKYWAAYMAPHGVRVNCISPGGIFNHQDPQFVEKYALKTPLNRMGNPEELWSVLDCLIDPNSSYLTGQNIVVDGGFSAW